MRIANLEEVQPAALQELNDIMEKQFAGAAGAQAAKMGGLKAAANIMNYLDTNIEGQLMDSIRESDEEMSQQIQDLMFVFENLIDVDDRGIQTMLREVPGDLLQRALKGSRRSDAREDLQEHVQTGGRNAGGRSGGHGANPGLGSGGGPEGDPLHRPSSGGMPARSCWVPVVARSSSKPWRTHGTCLPALYTDLARSGANR